MRNFCPMVWAPCRTAPVEIARATPPPTPPAQVRDLGQQQQIRNTDQDEGDDLRQGDLIRRGSRDELDLGALQNRELRAISE